MYEIGENCKKCGICLTACKFSALRGEKKKHIEITQNACLKCGHCFSACPFGMIAKDGVFGPPLKTKTTTLIATIDRNDCVGCRNCFLNCPNKAIKFHKTWFGAGHCEVTIEDCTGCGSCINGNCMGNCISLIEVPYEKKKPEKPKQEVTTTPPVKPLVPAVESNA